MIESALESLNPILAHEKKFREVKVENLFEKRIIVYPLIYGKIANMIDIQIEFLGTK